MMEIKKHIIDVSYITILKVVAVLLLVAFLFYIRDIILLFIAALIIASALDPLVDKMQTKHIPRGVTVLAIYVIFVALIVWAASNIIPVATGQSKTLLQNVPLYLEHLTQRFPSFANISRTLGLQNELASTISTSNVFQTTTGVFSGVASALVALVLSFYMVVSEDSFRRFLKIVVPREHQSYATVLMARIRKQIGRWLIGQLALMLIMFVMSYVSLLILGVNNALILAIIAGFLEVVPFVGPIIAIFPAVIVASIQSPVLGLVAVPVVFILLQQLEGHIFGPKIMGSAIGVNPIVVILGIFIGYSLAGITGAIFAVPIIAAVSVFLKDLWEIRKEDLIIDQDMRATAVKHN